VKYWLVKSEPGTYSWEQLVRDRRTEWDGVRNFEARKNLRAMKKGDRTLFYHSVSEKQVVGIAEVAREAYPDPTDASGEWSCVDLKPVAPLAQPVTLAQVKADARLSDVALVRRSRLSVVPLTAAEYKRILTLGKTKA
jgi:predicted RNA-binding protein with PUA-like domain